MALGDSGWRPMHAQETHLHAGIAVRTILLSAGESLQNRLPVNRGGLSAGVHRHRRYTAKPGRESPVKTRIKRAVGPDMLSVI
jgi:hypothetical protein